jgi:lipoprotein-anchoring transpeptidase ErfK/SrfK
MTELDRRFFAAGALAATAAGLAGCSTAGDVPLVGSLFGGGSDPRPTASLARADYAQVYGRIEGEEHPIAPFDYRTVDPAFLRQEVAYPGAEPPGTVVVDPAAHHLYLVGRGKRATRYGVGVGREGFGWTGQAQINMRRAWPDWIPPHEMVERDPQIRSQLVKTARGTGVPGGPRSPLGARAMYLFGEGRDLGYRIHGTTEPETIGTSVSSGCIRMVNQDVIHLYGRAPDGTRVVVLPA